MQASDGALAGIIAAANIDATGMVVAVNDTDNTASGRYLQRQRGVCPHFGSGTTDTTDTATTDTATTDTATR